MSTWPGKARQDMGKNIYFNYLVKHLSYLMYSTNHNVFLSQHIAHRGDTLPGNRIVGHKTLWKGVDKRNKSNISKKKINNNFFSIIRIISLNFITGISNWWQASKCRGRWIYLPWMSCPSSSSSSSKVNIIFLLLVLLIYSCYYYYLILHLCLIFSPQTIFIMGGGEGSTAREILRHKTVAKVVMCDIDEVKFPTSHFLFLFGFIHLYNVRFFDPIKNQKINYTAIINMIQTLF